MSFHPYKYTNTGIGEKNSNFHTLLIVLSSQILIFALLFFMGAVNVAQTRLAQNTYSNQAVLGAQEIKELPYADIVNVLLPVTPTLMPPPVLNEIVQEKVANKQEYTIAIIGDSMEDTMGPYADYFEHAIKKKYPNTKFNILNYGKGSQTVPWYPP